MSGCDTHREKVEEAAKRKGCHIVEPVDNELFIDIDDQASLTMFHNQIGIVCAIFDKQGVTSWRFLPSPSGLPDHCHIIVSLPINPSSLMRIALQALLGSDRLHELLSFGALREGAEMPTLRFEKNREGA